MALKSTKYEYRIVTAPDDRVEVQFRHHNLNTWHQLSRHDNIADARETIKKSIEDDDFKFTVLGE